MGRCKGAKFPTSNGLVCEHLLTEMHDNLFLIYENTGTLSPMHMFIHWCLHLEVSNVLASWCENETDSLHWKVGIVVVIKVEF